MLEQAFQDVYTKFKLHFYQNVFQRFATREATLTTVESFCMEGIMAMGEPTIAEFSRMMQISTPNAAYKIGSLVKKGYVEKIQSMLEAHQVQLLKDIAMLDKMYELNMAYFKELSMYILAGKKKLADVRANELQQAMDKAKVSGLPEDAQAARDLADQCERFEKKLYDLELTRNISLQMGPQIRLLQNNDTMMAEKIQSTIVNTIPLWKNQMVLALGLAHTQKAMQVEPLEEVIDILVEKLRDGHIKRLKDGICSIDTGVVFLDVLNNAERISDHCSNVAARLIGMDAGEDYDSHTLKSIMHHNPTKDYMLEYEECRKAYLVPLEEMEA